MTTTTTSARNNFGMNDGQRMMETLHIVLKAFWAPRTTPIPAHRAKPIATINTIPLPSRPSIWLTNASPTTGILANIVSRTSARSSGLPARMNPRMVTPAASNGKIEKKP